MRTTSWISAVAVLMIFVPASAETFRVAAGDERNLVRFASKATMESFDGTTSDVTGHVTVDLSSLTDLEIEMVVDLRSFDTGIEMRNRHMRENHLETEEFPTATFQGGALVEGQGQPLTTGTTVEVLVEGRLELHGVEQTIQVPLELTYDGTNLGIVGRFPVALSDYDIERPKFLVLKLADEQQVTVDVTAVPE